MDLHPDRPATRDFTATVPPAQRLRITTVPSRVRFAWLGVEKALAPELRDRAARGLDADPASLAASKKLIDTRHPAFRAVTAVRGRIIADWRRLTLPFPEPGIRLLRLEDVEAFDFLMAARSGELHDATAGLEAQFDDLKADAARRLGKLFDPADYPDSLLGCFSVRWDFPNPDPPANLAWLAPGEHQLEVFRIEARYEQAVRMAERALLDDFVRSVGNLTDQLAGLDRDGRPRPFREAAVADLHEFLDRYRRLDLHSDDQLDEMVALVRQTMEGVTPRRLRALGQLRRTVAARLSVIRASLDAIGGDRP